MALAIFIVSHQPNISLPKTAMEFNDKILHVIGYFVFGLTLLFAISNIGTNLSKINLFFLLMLLGVPYAVLDEFHQWFIPGRSFEIADMAADTLGLILSFFVYPVLQNVYLKLRKSDV